MLSHYARHFRPFLYLILLWLAACADPAARNKHQAERGINTGNAADTLPALDTATTTRTETIEPVPTADTAAPVIRPSGNDHTARPSRPERPVSNTGQGSGTGRGSTRPANAGRPRNTIAPHRNSNGPEVAAPHDTLTAERPGPIATSGGNLTEAKKDSMARSTLAYSYFDTIAENETRYIWATIRANATKAETETILKEHIQHVMAQPPKASDTNTIKSIYIKGYRYVTIAPDTSADFDIRLVDGEARQELDMDEGNNWRWSVQLKKGVSTPRSSITLRIKATNNINGLKDYTDQQVIFIDVKILKAEGGSVTNNNGKDKAGGKTGIIIGLIAAVLILAGILFRKKLAAVTGLKKKPQVFFSYAWGQEREQFVDRLYESLKADGYRVIRDKVSLGYKGVISQFMTSIGKGQFIVVAISDKYLTSEFCMFELFEIYRNAKMEKEELVKRIYPVCIENLNLNSPTVIARYFKFWEDKELEWEQLIKNNSGSISEEQQADYTRVKRIIAYLGSLLDFLADVNFLDQQQLSADNFQEIKTAIQNRMAEET